MAKRTLHYIGFALMLTCIVVIMLPSCGAKPRGIHPEQEKCELSDTLICPDSASSNNVSSRETDSAKQEKLLEANGPRKDTLDTMSEPESGEAAYSSSNPTFPGGNDSLFKYLAENLHYPNSPSLHGPRQDRVVLEVVVREDGSFEDIHVHSSSGYEELDNAALRAVSSMPKWIPGKRNGKPVTMCYLIPINFILK